MAAALRYAAAALVALAIASAHLLDGPTDIEAAQDSAASTLDAQSQAQHQARGAAQCAQLGRDALWMHGDHLVCRLPAGRITTLNHFPHPQAPL